MPRFLVAIYRPNGFDPAIHVDNAMRTEIDALNDEMAEAGVRFFAGGLKPTSEAQSLKLEPGSRVVRVEGTYLSAPAFMDGFWILDVENMDAAFAWGQKAALACRASVEVRAFY